MDNCPITGLPCSHDKCIHITDVDKNYEATSSKDLCAICGSSFVKEQSQKMVLPPLLMQFLQGLLTPGQKFEKLGSELGKTPIGVKSCSKCESTLSDIIKNSKLGCNECYEIFKEEIKSLLLKYHGSLQHKGKIPKNKQQPQMSLEQTNALLQDAIKKEDYELAAKLRDQIKKLQ